MRFIPVDFLFTEIIPRLNSRRLSEVYADKNQYEIFFRNVKHPRTLLKRMQGDFICNDKFISNEEAIAVLSNLQDVIVKPTINTQQGQGVFLFNSNALSKAELEQKFINEIGENYIVQERIKAHPTILIHLHKTP